MRPPFPPLDGAVTCCSISLLTLPIVISLRRAPPMPEWNLPGEAEAQSEGNHSGLTCQGKPMDSFPSGIKDRPAPGAATAEAPAVGLF